MLYNPPSGSTDPNAGYVGKDVAAGRQGSKLPPTVPEGVQREIVAIIAAAQALGLAAPTNADLAQMLKAVRSGLLQRFIATGTPDAIAIAPNPPYVGLVEGMRFRVKVPGAANVSNTQTVPTFVVNGIAPVPVVRRDGTALVAGDLVGTRVIELEIDADGKARVASGVASDTLVTVAAALIGIQNPLPAVTTAGTYNYTPSSSKVRAILVRIQAGGGGSGGSLNCTASQSSVGVPGGGGGYCEHYIVIPNAASFSAPFVVGAGGSAGTSSGTSSTAGGTGGTSSFGGGPTALGGSGGAAGFTVPTATITNTAGASGGAASGGNIVNIPGGGAQASQYLSNNSYGGLAGPSQLGKSALPFATTSPGATGSGYGAGATPGVTQPNGVGQQGAAGGGGLVQITEIL